MQGAVRHWCIVLVALAAGCTTSVDVAFDEHRDFSDYETWSWLARGSRVADGSAESERAVDRLTARLVEDGLAVRGLERVGDEADLLVTCRVEVAREQVAAQETRAEGLLSSHHAEGSFVVQATETRIDVYHTSLVSIDLTDRRSREVVWRGELRTRRQSDVPTLLTESISTLLSRLPTPAP